MLGPTRVDPIHFTAHVVIEAWIGALPVPWIGEVAGASLVYWLQAIGSTSRAGLAAHLLQSGVDRRAGRVRDTLDQFVQVA